jgi:D(-)-tartrate dehydratase
MRIVEARARTAPAGSAIRSGAISFTEMTTSVLALVTDQRWDGAPLVGFGFCPNGRYGPTGLLTDRLLPRLLGADPAELLADDGENLEPRRVRAILMRNEKPGGHGDRSTAVGAIDMAVWDIVAKRLDLPLHRLLARRHGDGQPDPSVAVYAAGGYYRPDGDERALRDEMRRYLDLGFTSVKMKIGGASLDEDLRRVEAVIQVVGDPSAVAVDSNGGLDRERALAYAAGLAPYGLKWWEEPCDPLDLELHAEIASRYPHPLATGENLFALVEVRNLLRHGGLRPALDVLQVDPPLAYGLVEYVDIVACAEAAGWLRRRFVPHGGHLVGLAAGAGLRLGGMEAYTEAHGPFSRLADRLQLEGGRLRPPEVPGVGLEQVTGLRDHLRDLLAS